MNKCQQCGCSYEEGYSRCPDCWVASCIAEYQKLAALRAPVPSGVTEAMVERFIAAMDVASDADVGREEGIRYALSAALAEAQASRAALAAAEQGGG